MAINEVEGVVEEMHSEKDPLAVYIFTARISSRIPSTSRIEVLRLRSASANRRAWVYVF